MKTLTKPLQKMFNYFGVEFEADDDKPQATAYHQATSDMSEHKYPSFSHELPYQYYDDKNQIFFNTYNAGLIYQVSPLTGANEALADQLDSIIRTKISDEFIIQVIQIKHNQVGAYIDRFSAQFKQEGLGELSRLGESLETYYKNAAKKGFTTRDEVTTRLTQSDIYIVIDMAKKAFSGQTEKDIALSIDRFKVSFQASLNASGVNFKACDATDFMRLMSFFLKHNPQSIYQDKPVYDDSQLLKYQLTDHAFSLEVDAQDKDHLRLSGDDEQSQPFQTAVTVLTLDKTPTSFKLWDNINNASNIFNAEYHLNCNHIITAIYKVDDHAKALSKANRKTRDLSKKAKSQYADMVAGTEEQAAQWKSFREDLTKQKTRSCKMIYNVILFSLPETRQEDVEKAINTFGFNNLKLAVCQRMQLPYFMVSMPFMYTGNLQFDFALPMMMHHISSWNATQYLPLLSDWQGQKKGILLPSIRGQFSLVDPFSGYWGTNFNVAVTGTSGAGKSFLMQMMALSTLFDGGNVYIIDIGGSYRKLCEAVGGVYLEYHNLAMNPFTHIRNIAESIDDLIDLFELLACPKKGASDNDTSALRTAILKAFERKKNDTKIDDVKDALDEIYDANRFPTARILAENIDKYTSKAEHGKAFNESSKFDPNARFIVVDLLEIKDKKNLIAPALLSVFSQYRKRVYESDRSIKKLTLIDEAWKFFEGDPRAIEFLVEGFRTGRRHNASFVTVTQGIDDYFKFAAAQQLWDNAALKLVLLQDKTKLTEFNKEKEMFSKYEMEVLKKFPEAKAAGYSQVHIRGQKLSTFQRLFVDPFTLVMMSSDGNDYSAVQKLQKQGVDFFEAVAQVARAHYGDMYD